MTPPVSVVMTAVGGEQISRAIDDSAALLGYEASNTEPPAGTVEFIDYPFTADVPTAERVEMLTEAVRKHQPKIAVGPDVEGDMTLSKAAEIGDRLLKHADTVVLVPKDAQPGDIPDRFRVGFPAADFGSDASHLIFEYANAGPIHILGGSLTVQLEAQSYGLDVASADGSAAQMGAQYGDVWTPGTPHWQDAGTTDYYQIVQDSLDNLSLRFAEVVGESHPTLSEYATHDEGGEADPEPVEDAGRNEARREARRRERGRGPPLADPDTGRLLDTAEDRVPAALDSDLNDHDREMLAYLSDRRDGDESAGDAPEPIDARELESEA